MFIILINMSEIYHQFVTDGRSPMTSDNYGIFPSMLKNHLLYLAKFIMPPVYDWWFLTISIIFSLDLKPDLIFAFFPNILDRNLINSLFALLSSAFSFIFIL